MSGFGVGPGTLATSFDFMAVSSSGPRSLPPDCETAENAMERAFRYHNGNARAVWLADEYRRMEYDTAAEIFRALFHVFGTIPNQPFP